MRVKRDGVRPIGLEGAGQEGFARECAKGGFMWGCRCFGENFRAPQIVMVRAGSGCLVQSPGNVLNIVESVQLGAIQILETLSITHSKLGHGLRRQTTHDFLFHSTNAAKSWEVRLRGP